MSRPQLNEIPKLVKFTDTSIKMDSSHNPGGAAVAALGALDLQLEHLLWAADEILAEMEEGHHEETGGLLVLKEAMAKLFPHRYATKEAVR